MESDFDEKLIEFVREAEMLWSKKSRYYKNTPMKLRIWTEISGKLNSTVEECIRRWKTLRDRFSREIKKKDMPSGSAGCSRPEWSLLATLEFLKDSVTSRR
ncbi:hypothetical protein ABEB36_015074 [Hypothenemus hampei]|uniref:MADF domain-containing protein n=1 Tax=Hypothenemus hampei TaxID=57062 RepID=A0ABD1E192_HYPHA